jgi:hypothetical protein
MPDVMCAIGTRLVEIVLVVEDLEVVPGALGA